MYKQISFVTESPRVRLNKRVFTVNITANFSTGRMLCESQGGDLLILENLAKDAAQLRLQPPVSGKYWIGLRGRQLCASGKASSKVFIIYTNPLISTIVRDRFYRFSYWSTVEMRITSYKIVG